MVRLTHVLQLRVEGCYAVFTELLCVHTKYRGNKRQRLLDSVSRGLQDTHSSRKLTKKIVTTVKTTIERP